jgi:hypothetical protein
LATGAGSSPGGPLSCTTMWTWQESAARLRSTVVRGDGLLEGVGQGLLHDAVGGPLHAEDQPVGAAV